MRFPDHHDYTEEEIRDVMHQAEEQVAEAIIITDKDAVKFLKHYCVKNDLYHTYIIGIEGFYRETRAKAEFGIMKEKLSRDLKGASEKTACVIPARYASTRLPGKPLADIAENGMIVMCI